MADHSEFSWATVEAYESDDLADEKCMEKVERGSQTFGKEKKSKGMWELFLRCIWDRHEEEQACGQTRSL